MIVMSLEFKSFSDCWMALLVVQLAAMIAFDTAGLRARMRIFIESPKRMPILWFGTGAAMSYWGLYLAWLLIRTAEMIGDHNAVERHTQHTSHPALDVLGYLVVTIGAIALVIAAGVWWQKRHSLEQWRVSRGKLFTALERMARHAVVPSSFGFPIYVLPVDDFAELCSRVRRGAVIPRLLLDHMSKEEINSVAARQMAFQSKRLYGPVFWFGLMVNVSAIGALWYSHLNSFAIGVTLVSLAVIEVVSVQLLVPRLSIRASMLAISLTQNPEAFFSAQRALERFGGSKMPIAPLEEIGRRTEVTSQALKDLLGPRPTPYTDDRYPTVGSYMDTGL